MSERYSKLFALPENLYGTGSPVVIVAGALLKDKQIGGILGQLKIKNIQDKDIKAVTVSILALDVTNNRLGEKISFQYLDLNVQRDRSFGSKTPIALPDTRTRMFTVAVTEVVFFDGTVWKSQEESWEPLEKPTPLENCQDAELMKQFRLTYGQDCQNFPKSTKDLWYCSCGSINQATEPTCHQCGLTLDILKSIDFEQLQKEKIVRLEKEAVEARKRDEESRKKAAHNKKIAFWTILPTVVVVVILLADAFVVPKLRYNYAVSQMEKGQFPKAMSLFEKLGDYEDSPAKYQECILETKYQGICSYMETEPGRAAIDFFELEDYKDSRKKSMECWNRTVERKTICAGKYHFVGLATDNTAVVRKIKGIECDLLEGDCGQFDVKNWCNLAAVDAGVLHSVGLMKDGTVVAVGNNRYGQCNVGSWGEIVAVSVDAHHTVGLKADGTVVAAGTNDYGQCDVSDWNHVISIKTSRSHTVGLKTDGTVVATGLSNRGACSVEEWTDIVTICTAFNQTVGIKSDGTVVATGENKWGQCDGVESWTDVVSVSAGGNHIVGLKSDGTVVAAGRNDDGQCNVDDWTDIVAIETGLTHTLGLKSDGTVVATGGNKYGQCSVGGWRDIALLLTSETFTIGVTNEGAVVAVGDI